MNNIAFIDGQNLFLGTSKALDPWQIDLMRLRVYLKEKYKVEIAYYYIGFYQDEKSDLYEAIQKIGFIMKFRQHSAIMKGNKKGNVDSDIVFDMMKKLYKKEIEGEIVLLSSDGDFYNAVEFLIEENKFAKILFPNRKSASSLYKKISHTYHDFLDYHHTKEKIEYKKRKRP